jgi:hypothetical protein
MDAPYPFKVDLDPDLFALDRLEALFRRAPGNLAVAFEADTGRERPAGARRVVQLESSSLEQGLADQRLHIRFEDLHEWATEYRGAREAVLEAAGVLTTEPHYLNSTVIRIFSPGVPVALHGDGETQLNVGMGGRSVWHVYPPSSLSQPEAEGLLRGGQFVKWREMTLFASYDLGVGDAFAAPPRWPHWIEHPGPEPAVSFEVSYWTADNIRDRKVLDVNWLLRRAKLSPRPLGESERGDRRKRKAFDAISLATRKGSEYRGV